MQNLKKAWNFVEKHWKHMWGKEPSTPHFIDCKKSHAFLGQWLINYIVDNLPDIKTEFIDGKV